MGWYFNGCGCIEKRKPASGWDINYEGAYALSLLLSRSFNLAPPVLLFRTLSLFLSTADEYHNEIC